MNNKSISAFTLAEVLITLAVIGVVAVLSIGIFMPKIQDKVLATQAKTAKIKFTKAMEQMALNNKIGPLYNDTEEFVSELQNYLKVAKVCDNEHLSDCFGYESFVDKENKEISLDEIKDGNGFRLPKNATNDFTGNTVGLVTIDGTPMVLAWNKKCNILEPGVYEWANNTNISTKCVAAAMDVNGTKRPDKLGRDIVLLNASTVANAACIVFTVNGQTYKWSCPFEPQPLNRTECLALKNAGKISGCADVNDTGYNTDKKFWTDLGGDYWASVVQTCGGTDKMPSVADLAAFVTYLYDGKIVMGTIGFTGFTRYCPKDSSDNYTNCLNTDKFPMSAYSGNDIGSRIWSGGTLFSGEEAYPAYSFALSFNSTNVYYYGQIRCGFARGVCKL